VTAVQTALITGVAGQTGSFLAEILHDAGWSVHGIQSVGSAPAPSGVALHEVDLRNHAEVAAVLRRVQPDAVVNLAALSSVALSWTEPVLTNEVNGLAVANLLRVVQELSDRRPGIRFVQASSGEVFGNSVETPQSETTPIAPVNPYGVAKASAHLLTRAYRLTGMHASNAILYNHESERRPERFVSRKITRAAARIAAGVQDELVLGDLEVERDWGWAGDYAAAIALMLRAAEGDDYVIATGESHTVREFVEVAFEAVGIEDWSRYVRCDAAFHRPAETQRMVGDPEKIRRVLRWRPTMSFEQMVHSMVRHDQQLLGGDPLK
jgi:GDPmannose 4,6-dehydratase